MIPSASLSLLALLAAAGARGGTERPEAFTPRERPAVFRIVPCGVVGVQREGLAGPSVTYAGRGAGGGARARLSHGRTAGEILMSVLDPKGALLAAPVPIADDCVRMLPVLAGDLNSDGREDFVAFVPLKPCGDLPCCDVGFALSTVGGYRVTALRRTLSPGARDFVDFGDRRCRFVHAELTVGASDATPAFRRLVIFRLMEFSGALVVMSGDSRFPRIVPLGSRESLGTTASSPVVVEPTDAQRLPPVHLYRRGPPCTNEVAQECSS